jgi:uncharacterized protein YbjT (DUF2867 family)
MKVAIAGGHGKIALRLTRLLNERGDEVLSLIRNPDQADDVREAGGEPVVSDLEAESPDEIAEKIDSPDATVFAAGAGPGSGEARKETMDYGGAVKLIEAAKKNGIRRYVIVSSIGANPNAEGGGYAAYTRAKGKADQALQQSGLDYTVVRPTRLTNDPGTGKVTIADSVGRSEVTRDDVAAVLAEVLREPATIGKTFELAQGDTPVAEAVGALAKQ